MLATYRDPLTEHPAKYSPEIMERLHRVLVTEQRRLGRSPWVLDPMAGVGRVHRLVPAGTTIGVEIQQRWADCHRRTLWGSCLAMPFDDGAFDAVVVSPTYANRMADSHNAQDGSRRKSYTHTYGEPLHPDNSGLLQWGEPYREWHRRAWAEAVRCLAPGGLFCLNVSDHVRHGRVRHVTAFHALTLGSLGLQWDDDWPVETPRMRDGANAEARPTHETILVLRAPGGAGQLRCCTCRTWQVVDAFARDKSRPTGISPVCKACRNAWAHAHREDTRPVEYAAKLLSRYGITIEQYDAMLEAQGGRCAICRTDEPGGNGGERFHVDHDHVTNVVRGLLCSACNSGLGHFSDDPERVRAALGYLTPPGTVPEAPGTVILGTDGDGTRPPYCSIHLVPLPCCGRAA